MPKPEINMSWSISFIGKPENLKNALEEHSAKLQSPFKEEFDEALPHILGLVELNKNENSEPFIKISANGSWYKNGEKVVSKSCTLNMEYIHGLLV